jgi:predicted amidohydrolase YtcJ
VIPTRTHPDDKIFPGGILAYLSDHLRVRMALAWLALAVCIVAQVCGAEPNPDLILYNGKIFTSNAAHPYVEALAIRGERISAAGDSVRIKALAGPRTKQIDLGGRTVIPGVNDAHYHIQPLWPSDPVLLNVGGQDPKWDEVKEAISDAVKKSAKGTLIVAHIGLTIFHDPTIVRETLDELSSDDLVILLTMTGHAAILNSAALRSTGVREDQQDPLGGRYERTADGKLTGVLREYAVQRMWRTLGLATGEAEAVGQLGRLFSQAVKLGVTSMQDLSSSIEPSRAVKLLEEAAVPIRVRIIRMPLTTIAGRDTQEGTSLPRHPEHLITVSGTKWMVDGVPVENTFNPREENSLPPGQPLTEARVHDGISHLPMIFPQKEMETMLRESLARHDQALFHVSGYPAAAAMLEAMKTTGGSRVWAGRRVRFEHGDGLFADLLPGAKEMGVVVVQNPTHHGPIRSILKAGIPVALGSDGPINPYLNIMLACLDSRESITREEAVIAYTRTSAYAEFQEKEKGTLEPGKLADLVVLSQDIFNIPLPALPETVSVLTLVGGKIVYDAKSIVP